MRQILIERARARGAQKRGGARQRVTLDERLVPGGEQSIDLLALDEALERLAAIDQDQARLVELRFFGGLTVEETAEAMEISPATVKRHWTVASAWLARELKLPEVFVVQLGSGPAFPFLWAVIGAALFVAVVVLLSGGRRE